MSVLSEASHTLYKEGVHSMSENESNPQLKDKALQLYKSMTT